MPSAACSLAPPRRAQASELRRRNDEAGEALVAAGLAAHQPLTVASQYAASFWTQRRLLLKKYFAIYFRSPHYSERGAGWRGWARAAGLGGRALSGRLLPAAGVPRRAGCRRRRTCAAASPSCPPAPRPDFVRLLMAVVIAVIYGERLSAAAWRERRGRRAGRACRCRCPPVHLIEPCGCACMHGPPRAGITFLGQGQVDGTEEQPANIGDIQARTRWGSRRAAAHEGLAGSRSAHPQSPPCPALRPAAQNVMGLLFSAAIFVGMFNGACGAAAAAAAGQMSTQPLPPCL